MITFKKICYLLFICLIFSKALFSLTPPTGINYESYLLQDKTVVHVLIIDPVLFDLVLVKANLNSLETVEEMAKRNHAIAAINGGFFKQNGKFSGDPVGILKIKDRFYGQPIHPRGAIGWSNNDEEVLFDQLLTDVNETCITILPQSGTTRASDWNFKQYILGGSPILVLENRFLTDFSSEKTIKSFLYKKHARSAVGVLSNGNFVFVAVDGTRNLIFSNSGITIPDLALFMWQIGCKDALNLDGGGSSTLIFQEQILNNPCGEFYNGHGNYLREVSDAILVIPK